MTDRRHILTLAGGVGGGKFWRPINSPASGTWGRYASGGAHPALDFGASMGQPVFAPMAGKVTGVRDYRGYEPRQPDGGNGYYSYGRTLNIAHGGNLSSFYAHMSDRLVRMGQQVAGGQTVGRAGDTGNSSGTHLHFEMRRNGNPFNYTSWLNSGKVPGSSGPSVSNSKPPWNDEVARALAIVGQPQSLVPTVMRRMNQESGGQARIVNRWDSNWQAGIPSVGLMQVIGPTYRAYKHPAYDRGPYVYGTSVDPMSNILASMRYAMARYGSLASAYNQPGGYDSGGWLQSGTSAVNRSGKPEAVLDPAQSRALVQLARALSTRQTGSGRAELVITNWRDGTGYLRTIAADEVDQAAAFAGTAGRMR